MKGLLRNTSPNATLPDHYCYGTRITASDTVGHSYQQKPDSRTHQFLDTIAKQQQYPHRTYFCPARGDAFHTRQWVHINFRALWDQYNRAHATAYALRHHYAIANINRWTDEGFGFDAKLLYLSQSMGHCTVESTKDYYALVPRLAEILEEKTGADFDKIVPEMNDEASAH